MAQDFLGTGIIGCDAIEAEADEVIEDEILGNPVSDNMGRLIQESTEAVAAIPEGEASTAPVQRLKIDGERASKALINQLSRQEVLCLVRYCLCRVIFAETDAKFTGYQMFVEPTSGGYMSNLSGDYSAFKVPAGAYYRDPGLGIDAAEIEAIRNDRASYMVRNIFRHDRQREDLEEANEGKKVPLVSAGMKIPFHLLFHRFENDFRLLPMEPGMDVSHLYRPQSDPTLNNHVGGDAADAHKLDKAEVVKSSNFTLANTVVESHALNLGRVACHAEGWWKKENARVIRVGNATRWLLRCSHNPPCVGPMSIEDRLSFENDADYVGEPLRFPIRAVIAELGRSRLYKDSGFEKYFGDRWRMRQDVKWYSWPRVKRLRSPRKAAGNYYKPEKHDIKDVTERSARGRSTIVQTIGVKRLSDAASTRQ